MTIFYIALIFSQSLNDFIVNDEDYASSAIQSYPSVSGSDSGGAVIWFDLRPPTHGMAVFACRLDRSGDTIGLNFRISEDTLHGCAGFPSLSADFKGDFMAVWIQPINTFVKGRRYSHDGAPLGPAFDINEFPGFCSPPSVAVDSAGKTIVIWTDDHDGSRRIYGQLYGPDGLPAGNNFLVYDSVQLNPVYTDVCWNRQDLITVVWASNNRIWGQRLDSLGNRIGNGFFINEDSLITGESYPAIKSDPAGNLLIAWTGIYQGQNVYARLFDTTAAPITGTIQLDEPLMDSSDRPDIALQDSIWFVVFQNGLGSGVYLQRLDNRGFLIGENIRVNEPVGYRNYWPKISTLGNGYIVVWDRRFLNNVYDIMGQMIASDGSLIGSNFVASDDKGGAPQYFGAVAADTSGNFFIVWDDFRSLDSIYHSPNQFGIMFHPDGQPFHRDTIIGQLPGGEFSAIAVNELGLYVSVWSRVNTADSLHQVFGQRFDRNGVFLGNNFQISACPPYTGLGLNKIYSLQNNNFIVFWNEIRPDSDYIRIYGRFLDPLGIPYGNEFAISLDPTANNESYSLVDEGNGRFIMCVTRSIDTVNITIRELDYSANPVSGPIVLNETPTLTNYFAGAKGLRQYIFAWVGQSGHSITGQIVDTNLQMIGNNFRVSDDTTNTKEFPRMVSNARGMSLVVWQQDYVNESDIYGQFFDSLGIRIGNNFKIDNDTTGAEQWLPDAYSKNGRIYLTWSDTRKPAQWYDIYCRVMEWPTLPYAGENCIQNYICGLSVVPNPFRTRTDIRLQIPDNREKTATLKIYDAAGRLVKSFSSLTGYPANRLVWNGADDTGRIAPAGVYFLDLVVSDTHQIRKIIKIH